MDIKTNKKNFPQEYYWLMEQNEKFFEKIVKQIQRI